tara:strand:- start:193 stop:408 length:216 start_codon:yes stop_codon:yes gene_type:complete
MYHLPTDIMRKIYAYDSTYKVKFNKVVEELDVRSLNRERVDMSLTREDVILLASTFVIGLYIFIDEHMKKT